MVPKEIVDKMMSQDAFSQWLGIEILKIEEGSAHLQMTVRPEMVNGFGIAHGGITYSLADSCLAFAANSKGNVAVSIETSISHIKAVGIGDILTAKASEISRSTQIGNYEVVIHNQENVVVAHFKGTVFVKSRNH